MNRRIALRSGLLAGVGMVAASSAQGAQGDSDGDARVARALRDLQEAITRQADAEEAHWRVVRRVQDQQRTFLRSNHRYPGFMEVGLRSWEGLVEWHVRERQALNVTLAADGRYTMAFMFTALVLRPEQDENYIGPAYDGR